jgi:hypothetical protein
MKNVDKRFYKVPTIASLLTAMEYKLYQRHIDDGNTFEYLADEFDVSANDLEAQFALIENKLREAFRAQQ